MKKTRWARVAGFTMLAVALTGCSAFSTTASVPKRDWGFSYTDVTSKSNLNFVHEKPTFDPKFNNIMPWLASTGAGVATADFDGDGYMDLYFVNSKKGSKNALYHNNGDGTFTEVGDKLGLDKLNQDRISTSALWFDYDNSGHPSLFVGTWGGPCYLFHNNGDGTFTDVTAKAGVGYKGYVSKVIALDYNKDGNLDLYLSCYFNENKNLFNSDTTKVMHNDFERARNGGHNVLLRNNGDGTFTDVSKEMHVDDTGWTLASGTADLNGDGWPDLYNANDFGPDKLYLNQQGKGFKQVVQKQGIGDDTYKGMNVDFADIFHNGKQAIYVSNVSKKQYILEGNQLWYPNDNGIYTDIAEKYNVAQAGFSWGARFFDADNSGNMSLMVTDGFISASKDRDYWFDLGTLATTPGEIVEDTQNWPKIGDKSLSGYEHKSLFLNDGKSFTNVASDVGIDFKEDGRGISAVDLLNRGTLDLVFANQGGPARVYKSENHTGNDWLTLNLTGTAPSSRDALGAVVTFEVNGVKTVIQKDDGENSHGGQSDPRIHFGLGKSDHADKITIQWPSGRKTVLTDVKANQFLEVKEPNEPLGTSAQK